MGTCQISATKGEKGVVRGGGMGDLWALLNFLLPEARGGQGGGMGDLWSLLNFLLPEARGGVKGGATGTAQVASA